jgi:hypothetical protein
MSGYPKSRRTIRQGGISKARSVFSRTHWLLQIQKQQQQRHTRGLTRHFLVPQMFQRKRQEPGLWKYAQHHRNHQSLRQRPSPQNRHTKNQTVPFFSAQSLSMNRKGSGLPILAYYPIHYGAEYLKESIQSIEKFVDEILIFYSPWPSYGFNSNLACPETEDQIKNVAMSSSNKVTWIRLNNRPSGEGEHRQLWRRFVRPYHDLVLQFDADEVWEEQSLRNSLSEAMKLKYKYRNFGIDGFKHFWKSFSWHCTDSFLPIRIISLRAANNDMTSIKSTIYHFGYAQSSAVMNYKFEIHGHKQEIRSDWLQKTYYGWKPGQVDVHPTSVNLWNPQPFDKNTLPASLKNHPNFNKEVI